MMYRNRQQVAYVSYETIDESDLDLITGGGDVFYDAPQATAAAAKGAFDAFGANHLTQWVSDFAASSAPASDSGVSDSGVSDSGYSDSGYACNGAEPCPMDSSDTSGATDAAAHGGMMPAPDGMFGFGDGFNPNAGTFGEMILGWGDGAAPVQDYGVSAPVADQSGGVGAGAGVPCDDSSYCDDGSMGCYDDGSGYVDQPGDYADGQCDTNYDYFGGGNGTDCGTSAPPPPPVNGFAKGDGGCYSDPSDFQQPAPPCEPPPPQQSNGDCYTPAQSSSSNGGGC